VVHSLIELCDGSVLAQLGVPDMRVPIAVALAWPERLPLLGAESRLERELPALDLTVAARLDFEEPDRKRFPCLELAYAALRGDEAAPAALNAANEISVAAFLAQQVPFAAIAATNAAVLEAHLARSQSAPLRNLEDVLEADAWARARARSLLSAGVVA
jgi:1-deoxy-D-xylulose-5-phosphate reductoisomerase